MTCSSGSRRPGPARCGSSCRGESRRLTPPPQGGRPPAGGPGAGGRAARPGMRLWVPGGIVRTMSTEPRPLPGDPLAALARELLAELGGTPPREALPGAPARVAESLRFLPRATAPMSKRSSARRLLRGLPGDGAGEGRRGLQPLRASPPALPRQGPHRLHAAGPHRRAKQATPHRRRLRPPLQVQERLTTQIAEAIDKALRPQGWPWSSRPSSSA